LGDDDDEDRGLLDDNELEEAREINDDEMVEMSNVGTPLLERHT